MNRSRLAALSAGAMFLAATVLAPATAFAAGTGTLSLSPNNVNLATGSTFFVDISSQADVATSGASASVDFDASKLQITSVTKPAVGTGWNASGTTYVLPSASAISSANSNGHLSAIGAFFTDGSSSLPASTSQVLARVTFFAAAAGTSDITLPTSGSDGGAILDGTSGSTYGSPVAVTTTGSTITVTSGGASNSSVNTNVTGTVDAGYVALTCPSSVILPLVRNVDNVKNFECEVGSNVTWTLNTLDTNSDSATHGFLRDTTQTPPAVLQDPLWIHSNGHVDASGNLVYDTDVNLSASLSPQAVATGQNNVSVPLTFTQFAQPNDVAGSYGMQVLFSAVSTF